MLTERQAFLVSFAAHVAVIVALVTAGVLVARRALRPETMELDLLAPVQVGPRANQGARTPEEQPKPPEEEPKVVERTIPEYNPNASINLDEIPKIKEEPFTPYKPKTITIGGDGSAAGGTSYGSLIIAACKRNWTPPGRGVLGRPVPSTDVEITVARDGQILSSRITGPSGNAALDRSVLEAIRLSNPLPAFPAELTGAQRTFPLTFIPED
jgi:TonB family protein